ncbi:MAG: helix-turn-helix transcriptional regulator [Oscillospiraceae bacterium]
MRDISCLRCYDNTEVRTMRDIGKNIKELRCARGLTQEELGRGCM